MTSEATDGLINEQNNKEEAKVEPSPCNYADLSDIPPNELLQFLYTFTAGAVNRIYPTYDQRYGSVEILQYIRQFSNPEVGRTFGGRIPIEPFKAEIDLVSRYRVLNKEPLEGVAPTKLQIPRLSVRIPINGEIPVTLPEEVADLKVYQSMYHNVGVEQNRLNTYLSIFTQKYMWPFTLMALYSTGETENQAFNRLTQRGRITAPSIDAVKNAYRTLNDLTAANEIPLYFNELRKEKIRQIYGLADQFSNFGRNIVATPMSATERKMHKRQISRGTIQIIFKTFSEDLLDYHLMKKTPVEQIITLLENLPVKQSRAVGKILVISAGFGIMRSPINSAKEQKQ